MGRVFLGVSPGGRKVAVKLMLPGHSADGEFRQRFAREVAAARQVGGFHTAPVVDADPAADPPWMVTAYIPGPALDEVVRSTGPLGPGALRALGAGLAEGLSAVHAAGLIHRDLKPGNVIVAEDGPRIIDFGIAKATDATPLTSAGVLIGTLSFMPPEQVRGERLGPESDVFSLGSVLAYAATGHGPFDSATAPAIIYRIATEPPDLGPLSGPLRGVISECLAKNPADRPTLDRLPILLSDVPGQFAPGEFAPGRHPTVPARTAHSAARCHTPARAIDWRTENSRVPGHAGAGCTPVCPRYRGHFRKLAPVSDQASGCTRRRTRRCPGDSPGRLFQHPWRHGNQWRRRRPGRPTWHYREHPARKPATQYFQRSAEYLCSSRDYLCSSRDYLCSSRDYLCSSRDYLCSSREFRRKYLTGPSDRDDRLHHSGG